MNVASPFSVLIPLFPQEPMANLNLGGLTQEQIAGALEYLNNQQLLMKQQQVRPSMAQSSTQPIQRQHERGSLPELPNVPSRLGARWPQLLGGWRLRGVRPLD